MLANAQSPADWWYFGTNAGVHFTPAGPVADTNGQLATVEGCASISSDNGDLLFYTDGSTVYDATHNTMPNGTGLLGSFSSSQSAIIVPRPGNSDQYYIFTVPVSGTIGMHYSLVDMTLNSGLGDVVVAEKNVFLHLNSGENVCALAHANGNDYWVATHIRYSDTIKAYHISAAGVNMTPVISTTGDSIIAYVGSIKASPDSKYIGLAKQTFGGTATNGNIGLYQFNNATGEVTDHLLWSSPNVTGPYGVEFSPNSKVMYISDGWGAFNNSFVQYDISTFDLTAITSSEYLIVDSLSFGQCQIGPDLKIYLSTSIAGTTSANQFLHVVHEPNVLGVGCDFEENAVYLEGRISRMGLPPFLSSFFAIEFDVSDNCINDTTCFSPDTAGVDSILWTFGDPASGSLNTSTELFPCHFYADTGSYTVTVVAWSDTLIDTLSQQVFIYPRQTLNLGPDTTACFGDTILLDVSLVGSLLILVDCLASLYCRHQFQ